MLRVLSAALLCAAAFAQETPPASPCRFDGFSGQFRLAEARGQNVKVHEACAPGRICASYPMRPSHPMEVYKDEGAWVCGYYSAPDIGGGPVWVRADDVQLVPIDNNPPLSAWSGIWRSGTIRVVISDAGDGRLAVKGTAYWQGQGDNRHYGSVAGTAAPDRNHLRIESPPGETGGCVVDLTLYGPYILANDNDRCGGMNVRFWGIWRRAQE